VLAVLCAAVFNILPTASAQSPGIIRALPPIDAEAPLVRLPAVDTPFFRQPPIGEPAFRVASDPTILRSPEEVLAPPNLQLTGPKLTSHKNTFFQKLSFTGTEVFPDGSDGLGIFETELFAAFALPAPTTETPLILIPSLEVDFVDSPSYASLPATLYAAYFDFMWLPKFGDRLQGVLSVAPGWYSDFEDGAEDSFRLTGRGIARYDWTPDRLQLVLGVAYLDRVHTRILPVAGVIWKPRDDWNLELVFPKAKIARRMTWGVDFEHWFYLGGGFGGDNWSVLNPSGTRDKLVMRDWRLTLGWERKMNGGAGFGFETGYVFSREFEYVSSGDVYKPDGTLLLRGFLAL
jgi:hypothetical protein